MSANTCLNNNQPQYETYEWDNVWLDHAEDLSRRRVLYIGDSISCGSRHIATGQTCEEILFDGFGTSKALDNPYFKDAIHLFAAQESQRSAVLFNNGLHGFHLDDKTEYPALYEQMVKFLLEEFEGTPVLIVLTTHVTDAAMEQRVILRNKAAREIATRYELPVVDLYAVSAAKDELSGDGVHFTESGYRALAAELVAAVKNL